MKIFEQFVRALLLAHDPVSDIDEERQRRVRQQVMMRAKLQPQMKPEPHRPERRRFQWAYEFNPRRYWPHLELMPGMKLALGCGLVILGLWVGRTMNLTQTQLAAAALADQKISVMALASPWDGWIDGGE